MKEERVKKNITLPLPPPPVTVCQNAIFQIRLYLDNLLNCNGAAASRHITIGTSLLNKSDTQPSLCRRRQINVGHRANNISSASRVAGLSLGCYIGFISLSAGRGLLTEVSKFMSNPHVWVACLNRCCRVCARICICVCGCVCVHPCVCMCVQGNPCVMH